MYILRRNLPVFGVDLVWTGKEVYSCQMSARKVHILEKHEAKTLKAATEIMKELENSYHDACTAMV